jgi:hypothetical protein
MDHYAIDLVPSCMVKDKKDIDFVVIGVRGERMLEMWESPGQTGFRRSTIGVYGMDDKRTGKPRITDECWGNCAANVIGASRDDV